jgi:cyclopropane-fatty-acyl-phospholipid synthase
MKPETTTFSAVAPAAPASFWQRQVLASFAGMTRGHLRIELPDGSTANCGGVTPAITALPTGIAGTAAIRVRRPAFFRKCVLAGDIGFAEAFIDGDWDTPDLAAVIAFFILNVDSAPTLSGSRNSKDFALNRLRAANRLGRLRLQPTDHVLEIGTGWGGWALHAARTYGCRVTSVTISQQQYEFAQARIAAAGLSGRVQVELRDYRDLTGVFDKIVSIEMMEALGHGYLPEFCRTLARHGLIALQFITCPDDRYEQFRRGVDFIQKHVFPGSLLLSLNRVNDQLSQAGGFVLNHVEDFGHDYARTLRTWRENFQRQLDAVRALGFDERFIRKWHYYLSYCEAAFALRNISVVHTLHTRSNNLSF